MRAVLESLSDPFWLVGSGVLATCAIACMLMVRSPEIHLSREKQRFGTRLVLLVATFCWLLGSLGVLLLHTIPWKDAKTSSFPSTMLVTLMATHTEAATPTLPATPTPLPVLAQSPTQVLTTYCDAINANDTTTIWDTYTTSLQDTLHANAANADAVKRGLYTFISCDSTYIDIEGATDFLFMQTSDSSGHSDGSTKFYRFTLQVQDQAWKIQAVAYCMADGCPDFAGWMAP